MRKDVSGTDSGWEPLVLLVAIGRVVRKWDVDEGRIEMEVPRKSDLVFRGRHFGVTVAHIWGLPLLVTDTATFLQLLCKFDQGLQSRCLPIGSFRLRQRCYPDYGLLKQLKSASSLGHSSGINHSSLQLVRSALVTCKFPS